jgi:hypothetical protein
LVQVNVQVSVFVLGSCVAFSLVAQVVGGAHSWVHLHLLVLHDLVAGSPVKTNNLFAVNDSLDATVVEFF